MVDKELKFRILIKRINDLVHLEASFERCDFCMVSAFLFQKKKTTFFTSFGVFYFSWGF